MRATSYHGYAVRRSASRSWVTSVLLFPACAYYLLTPNAATPLDTASYLMYDSGWFLSGVLEGQWVYAGGALLQILLPLALVLFFLYHRYGFGLQVFLFWLGQNLVNVSTYFTKTEAAHPHRIGVRDVQSLLVGMEITEYAVYIGAIVFAVGCLCFLVSLLIPRMVSR